MHKDYSGHSVCVCVSVTMLTTTYLLYTVKIWWYGLLMVLSIYYALCGFCWKRLVQKFSWHLLTISAFFATQQLLDGMDKKRQWWLAKEHWTFLYYTILAYPGIHIGGCLIVCMESAHKKILWSHLLSLTTPTQLRTSRHFEVYTIKNRTSTCLHGPRGYKVWWYVAIDELTGDYKAWQSPDNGLVQ